MKPTPFWLVGEKALTLVSASHVYVLVNLRPSDGKHEFYVVPSRAVAQQTRKAVHLRSTWSELRKTGSQRYRDRWQMFEARSKSGNSKRKRHGSP